MKATAVIPVKRFTSANRRLASAIAPRDRAALAEAMFHDTIAAVRRCRQIADLIVVTAGSRATRWARWVGAEVLTQDMDRGHSPAAVAGISYAKRRGADRVAVLPIDCPLLDPGELSSHIGSVPRSAVIVPDRHGTGTNGLILSPPDAFWPAFGPDSCARHVSRARAAGIAYAVERVPSLELDVDTPEDLRALREALLLAPGKAPRTAEVVFDRGLGEEGTEETAETAVA